MFGGKKKRQRLEQAGVNANAVLVEVRDTGMTVNDNPRVKLVFEVAAANGSGTFQIETKQTVSRVAIPRAGDTFVVRYDPDDVDNFELVGATGSGGGAPASLDGASAGDVAAAFQAGGSSQVQRGSAAEL